MRPLVRSYGDNSTDTLSPAKSLGIDSSFAFVANTAPIPAWNTQYNRSACWRRLNQLEPFPAISLTSKTSNSSSDQSNNAYNLSNNLDRDGLIFYAVFAADSTQS